MKPKAACSGPLLEAFAEGSGHSVKVQKPSVKALPSAALGKELSEKNLTANRLFVEGHLSDIRQSLFRGPTTTLGKEKQPSTTLLRWWRLCRVPTVWALGKDIFYFFSKTLCRVPRRQGTRQRHFLFFLKNSLPSASPAWHSAKIFCFFFKKKSLPSAMSWHSAKFPSFAECHDHCTRQINRNCNFFLFFAFHWHKQFKYISHVTYIS